MNSTVFLKIGNYSVKIMRSGKIADLSDASSLRYSGAERIIYFSTNRFAEKRIIAELKGMRPEKVVPADMRYIKNGYAVPARIGIDRLLGCEYIMRERGKKDFVLVDLGTAYTVNIVKKGILEGGFIVPSIRIYLGAVSSIGDLPEVSGIPRRKKIGKDTKENILCGADLVYRSFFDRIYGTYGDVYATGGDKAAMAYIDRIRYIPECALKALQAYE